MARLSRRVTITFGLLLLGVLAGALVGGLTLVAVLFARRELDAPTLLQGIAVGGRVGAFVGALAAPVLGWSTLRHVPIGRALATVVLSPLAGAVVGALLDAPWAVPLAFLGLLVGVALVARRAPAAETAKP